MRIRLLLLLLTVCHFAFGQQIIEGTTATVTSVDKNLSATFYQKRNAKGSRTMYYTVYYKNKEVIKESALDIILDNRLSESAMALKVDTLARWTSNLKIKKINTISKDTSWIPVTGERSVIRDNYNALLIQTVKEDNPMYSMNVEIRAYNGGIAIHYFFPENPQGTYYRVKAENTEFSMPEGTKAWHALWAQAPYKLLPLNNWPNEAERPLTLQLKNGLYVCLAEAAMVDYARAKFKLIDNKANTIVTSMYTPADLISPIGTPWRVIMVAEKAGDLIENNSIILNLNEPSKIKDISWIKPGKFMRLMTHTTEGAKENIDFIAKHKMQDLLIDWRWYGPPFAASSDATKVGVPNFDLPATIQYAKDKNIGVWLYVNLQALYLQSDSLFSIYHKWGIKGVKFGFVQAGSHRWTTWLEEMIKRCAENHLMVDVHDDWRPTGEQRTWPNLMTAEGIRGNEEMPDATHNTILPFTRFIAGPADYTICYYDKRIKNTHAHQLALAAIYFSPMTTLYWYDKPSMSNGEPELEFWDKIPTTWDETKVLQGVPGQFISTARRKGDDWFIGTITNTESRTVLLNFNFLTKGKKYIATIYSDDDNVLTKTKVKIEKKTVVQSNTLSVVLKPSGGQAIWITPLK